MPIESNMDEAAGKNQSSDQPRPPQGGENLGMSFSGASFDSSAPDGTSDFTGLRDFINLGSTDSTVEPYLSGILDEIRKRGAEGREDTKNYSYERLQRLMNVYVFKWQGPDNVLNFFAIQFVNSNDQSQPNFVPSSDRMKYIGQALRQQYNGAQVRLVDARVILSNYDPDMQRTAQMAATIVRTIRTTALPQAREATVKKLLGTEYSLDWNVIEARKLERELSPHGVPPRVDVGMVMKAKVTNPFAQNQRQLDSDVQWVPVGVIGGFIEFRDQEFVMNNLGQQVKMFRPIMNITVCNSVIPLTGVALMMLAAFAPTIYKTKYWHTQWPVLQDNSPNPGLLLEDPDNRGKPFHLNGTEDKIRFLQEYATIPEIVIQFQDGRDVIPGLQRLATTDIAEKRHFIDRLTGFFDQPSEDLSNYELSRTFEYSYDGVYGDASGKLYDSRDIDYLYIAAKSGFGSIDNDTRRILLNPSPPQQRAQITANMTGTFTSLYLDSMTAINSQFIDWVANKARSSGLVIVDQQQHDNVTQFGSLIQGFGSGMNMSNMTTSGVNNRGLGLASIWYNGYNQ